MHVYVYIHLFGVPLYHMYVMYMQYVVFFITLFWFSLFS